MASSSGSGQLSASQVQQAKEAISVLNSLISTPQGSGATSFTPPPPPPPETSSLDQADDDFETRRSKGILVLFSCMQLCAHDVLYEYFSPTVNPAN